MIDVHSHQPVPMTRAQLDTVAGSMAPLNIRLLVNTGDPGSGPPVTDECQKTPASGERLARSVAADLSREFSVLRAPTLYYGVNVASERAYAAARPSMYPAGWLSPRSPYAALLTGAFPSQCAPEAALRAARRLVES